MAPGPKDAPIGRGKATSIFETDINSRDDLRYYGKKLTDPINTVEVFHHSKLALIKDPKLILQKP
jgi:hypothetical protein